MVTKTETEDYNSKKHASNNLAHIFWEINSDDNVLEQNRLDISDI